MSKLVNESIDNAEEIDLVAIIKTILVKKRLLFKIVFTFFILGLFLAIFYPKEYSASTIFVTNGGEKTVGSNIGGLAALAGINIGGNAGESGIPLKLYPEILNDITFQRELLKTELSIKSQENKVTYKEYYTNIYKPGLLSNIKKYTIGLPGLIKRSFFSKKNNIISKKNDNVFEISSEEKALLDKLSKQVFLTVDENDNFIELTVKMPEAKAAADLAYKTQKLLESYIINIKVKKSSQKLEFIKKRYTEKEKDFKRKQQRLANFQDRNKYSSSLRSQVKKTNLQSEYNMAFNVLNELAKQIETQQIQVKEDVPIFTVVKPVVVPVKPESKSLFILFSLTLLGLILGIGYIYGSESFTKFKEKLAESQLEVED